MTGRKLSRESEYGIKALLVLATKPSGMVIPLGGIAAEGGLPKYFLAKIFQKLAQHGVVRSFRGVTRGYTLARSPKEISLKEILEVIEGPGLFNRCIFWSDHCADQNPCLFHGRWKGINHHLIEKVMAQTTLADLVTGGAEQ